MRARLRTAAVALVALAALGLTACGSDGSASGPVKSAGGVTWPGTANDAGNGDAISVGGWKGEPSAVKITCSGSDGAVTAVVEAPGGWTATTVRPKGGGDAGVEIEGQGKSVEVAPHGDASVRWGVTATFGTGFPLEDAASGLKFYAGAVSCQK